jgi:aminopeptidase-like protein
VSAKYGEYPEYHTDHDDISLFSHKNFSKQLSCYLKFFDQLETLRFPRVTSIGEPMLSPLDLYQSISDASKYTANALLDLLYLSNGKRELKEIQEILKMEEEGFMNIYRLALHHQLITI